MSICDIYTSQCAVTLDIHHRILICTTIFIPQTKLMERCHKI